MQADVATQAAEHATRRVALPMQIRVQRQWSIDESLFCQTADGFRRLQPLQFEVHTVDGYRFGQPQGEVTVAIAME
jgi:hypothetical protein